MGYLSQTVKKEEGAFESFYGTNIAGSTVAASEMNEQEVCNCFYHVDLPFEPRPPRCPRPMLIVTSKTNVSAPASHQMEQRMTNRIVLMDGTPALNLASFVTTYM